MTTTALPRTANGASVYDTRPGCPARFHDSYSATRKGGCVCPAAIEARRRYFKRQQMGRLDPAYVDSIGTRRRLQALNAIGYTVRDITSMLGWTNPGVIFWSQRKVHRETARRVEELFERLSATPGPSERAKRAAVRSGYLPPLAWGDDIDDPNAVPDVGGDGEDIVDVEAVRRVAAGVLPFTALREAEKVALFQGPVRDWSYSQTSKHLRMSSVTIDRWRARAEQEVAA